MPTLSIHRVSRPRRAELPLALPLGLMYIDPWLAATPVVAAPPPPPSKWPHTSQGTSAWKTWNPAPVPHGP